MIFSAMNRRAFLAALVATPLLKCLPVRGVTLKKGEILRLAGSVPVKPTSICTGTAELLHVTNAHIFRDGDLVTYRLDALTLKPAPRD